MGPDGPTRLAVDSDVAGAADGHPFASRAALWQSRRLSALEKYDRLADGFAEREYADPARYSARRARLIVELGPRLGSGDTVVDLCCADGVMAAPLRELGLRYVGVDASDRMLEAARRRDPAASFVQQSMEQFTPGEPVDATVCLRSFYLAPDRPAFFRHVLSFTKRKFVFDFEPAAFDSSSIVRELRAAGFGGVELRPFLVPQRHRVSPALVPVLAALEHSGPVGMRIARRVGCVFACATVD